MGPTTLFSHSNCLLTFEETSVLLSVLFFLFSARLGVAPVDNQKSDRSRHRELEPHLETSVRWGLRSPIIPYSIRRSNYIVGEIMQ